MPLRSGAVDDPGVHQRQLRRLDLHEAAGLGRKRPRLRGGATASPPHAASPSPIPKRMVMSRRRLPPALQSVKNAALNPFGGAGIFPQQAVLEPEPTMTETIAPFPPLTVLSEEEELFREPSASSRRARSAARAARWTRPRVPPRSHRQVLRARPDGHRGARAATAAPAATIFLATLAIEELARVDASAAIYVDVQNTLVNNALAALGQRRAEGALLPRA